MRVLLCFFCFVVTACVTSDLIPCVDQTCPGNTHCEIDENNGSHCVLDTCGNGSLDPGEACDCPNCVCDADDPESCDQFRRDCRELGFYEGKTFCDARCELITDDCRGFCGDGVRDSSEQCDGYDHGVAGSCQTVGGRFGTFGCSANCQNTMDNCYYGLWRIASIGWEKPLHSVWAFDRNHVWIGGEQGVIGYFDGHGWSSQLSPLGATIQDFHGSATDDVWAVGDLGSIAHFDGESWTKFPPPTNANLWSILAVSPELAWAAGEDGVYVYDGSTWEKLTAPTISMRPDLWSSGTDLWIATGPTLYYLDDIADTSGTFVTVPLPAPSVYLNQLSGNGSYMWGFATGDGTAYRFDGDAWTPFPLPFSGRTLWASPDGEGVYVTGNNRISRFDGVAFVDEPLPAGGLFFGLGGGDERSVFAASTSTVLSFDGPGWRNIAGADDSMSTVDIWGLSPDDIWALGSSGIRHFDGQKWTTSPCAADCTTTLGGGIWGVAQDDLWAVLDGGRIRHFDGETWTPVPSGTTAHLKALWGSSANDIWAVGVEVIVHWDGETWTPVELPPIADFDTSTVWFNNIWGSSKNDVYVAGDYGNLLHYNGTEWHLIDLGTDAHIEGVYGSSKSNVWIVGDESTMFHFNGTAWTRIHPGTAAHYRDVWASDPGNLWIVGDAGEIGYYDGNGWTFSLGATLTYHYNLWGTSADDMWIAVISVASSKKLLHLGNAMPRMQGGACDSPVPIYCGARLDEGTHGRPVHYRLHSPIDGEVQVTLTPKDFDLDLIASRGDDADGTCDLTSDGFLGSSHSTGTTVDTVNVPVRRGQYLYFTVSGDHPSGYAIALDCTRILP
jgi:hypothetical protein